MYSAGKLIAEYSTVIAAPGDAKTAYTTTDHLGTPRVITDELGQVKARRDFMPFGEELFINVGGRTPNLEYGSSDDDVRQKFTGYQKDNETGLDFAEARMYANNFGRFTAVDPLLASGQSANPQTFNRYVYTANRPLAFVDPTGLFMDDWFIKRDGSIDVYRTGDTFDRFYVQHENTDEFTMKGQLEKNQFGLVEFPQSGWGFTSYNSFVSGRYVEQGGYDKVVKEQTGIGDHWLRPVVAAALFGLTNSARNRLGTTIALGDMSSSNGSDPWNPNDTGWGNHGHHGGHGHAGNKSGEDIDWRYVDKNGNSQRGEFKSGSKIFDKAKNEALYTLAEKWGFTKNYTGLSTPILGVKREGGHDNHGHFGFTGQGLKITQLKSRPNINRAPEKPKGSLIPPFRSYQIRP